MKLKYYSASRLKTYKQCETKYFGSYHLGIPRGEPHQLTRMGSSVHKAFEISNMALLSGRREHLWNPHDLLPSAFKKYNVLPEDHQLSHDLVQNGLDWGYFDNLHNVISCELKIDIVMPDGRKLIGYIDRLDKWGDNGYDIIDLKTQKRLFTKKELEEDFQAALYNIAIRMIDPDTDKVKVSFWVLRHKVQTVIKTKQDAEDDLKMLMDLGIEISANKAPKQNSTPLCPWCDFKDECPSAFRSNITAKEKLKRMRKLRVEDE